MDRAQDNGSFFDKLGELLHQPLTILILITGVLVAYLLKVQIKIGVPYWDVFNYLNNALHFANMGSSGVVNHLPPLIPVVTSLVFRMGYVSVDVIFLISGLIFILGVIGLYLLLKERFDPTKSLAGSLIFISLPVIMAWAVSGGIDLPGVVFSIWALYFLVIGLNKDSKFLFLVLPLLVVSLLTRYTAGLIVVPMIFYILANLNQVKEILHMKKKVILGILIELGVLLAIFTYFILQLDTSALFGLFFDVVTSSSSGVEDVAYNSNLLYFLQNSLNYISLGPVQGTYRQLLNPSEGIPSVVAYMIAIISVMGISSYIYRVLSTGKENDISRANLANLGKLIVVLVLFMGLVLSFYNKSLILSEIFLLVLVYLLYRFMARGKFVVDSKLALDLMFLSWFGAYFIFHGILPFKVDRYFITMAPAFTYFIILGLSQFMGELKPRIKGLNSKSGWIYLMVALICLSSATATYIGHTPQKTFTVDINNASEWIKGYDPGYSSKVIGSDYPNAVTWYLHQDTTGAYPKNYNNTEEFADYLQENGVYYYFDSNKSHPNLQGYHIIKTFGVVAIYEKTTP
ncbi:glycosyltransferase family 39 protein [Methanobacterium formicicum]|uniref:Putative membrane protein n=1 Tax=Methanobacterium formicicum TaxID=2162 RepID=A0A090I4T4_METFO|nr:glycosyltransferase family 39 protein [Methanobacterium formicicum]MDH2659458.1 glycosyltransferase family 39 protein [Methanobacterium formicicum]CEA14324.1 putative membrane protein [Methanobacterium formicicum]